VNGRDIYSDVGKAVQAWEEEKWYDFGLNIGHALNKIVGN